MPEGKVALITGGSAGIGLAVARKLVAAGYRVALVARTERALREAAGSMPGMAGIFPLDVKELDQLAALPKRVVEKMGGLDVVVNNAGVHYRGPVLELAPEKLAEMVTVNLTAPIVLCRAAVPLMNPGGSIVNIASLAGMVPARFQVTYGATKAGLRQFSRALRQELAPRRISVSVVSPGPVDTNFWGDEVEKVADITFSQPMISADTVADAVMSCIREGDADVALPWFSGKLATLGNLSPGLLKVLQPVMERRGAKAKRAYIERRKGRPAAPPDGG